MACPSARRLTDLGYHAVYVFEEITGQPLDAGQCTVRRSAVGVPDQAQARWQAGADVSCDVDLSWSAPASRFEVHATGTEGDAVLTDDGKLVIRDATRQRVIAHRAGFPPAYEAFYRDLARRLLHPPDYQDAATAVRVSRLLDQALSCAQPETGGEDGCPQ